jgi:hypothetical protein
VALFVDTGGWLALYDKGDRNHCTAKSAFEKIKKDHLLLFTSDYVFDESVTLIRHRVSHSTARSFGNNILESRIVRFVDVTREDRTKAWEIFSKYKDVGFSFTDCTSFVIMKRLKLETVLGFDSHFKIMGFNLYV